jgi:hypothetical protein
MSDDDTARPIVTSIDTSNIVARIDTSHAFLPEVYKRACEALAQCEQIDECQDLSDKMQALASYAKQAKDKTLHDHAQRIQDRATRRLGELLHEIKALPGARTDLEPDAAAGTRSQAARDAGLSPRQAATAQRVANVPDRQFEEMVESDNPPTVTQLADIGKKRAPVEVSLRKRAKATGLTRTQIRAASLDLPAQDQVAIVIDLFDAACLEARKVVPGVVASLSEAQRREGAQRCWKYIHCLYELCDASDPTDPDPKVLRGFGTYPELLAQYHRKQAAAKAEADIPTDSGEDEDEPTEPEADDGDAELLPPDASPEAAEPNPPRAPRRAPRPKPS